MTESSHQTTPAPENGEPEPAAAIGERSSTGLEPNVAGLLCYLLGWITGIIFLVLEKQSSYVRFHALQSTVTFLALHVIAFIGGWVPVLGLLIGSVAGITALILWIVLMVKAFQGERWQVPIVGEIAEERSAL